MKPDIAHHTSYKEGESRLFSHVFVSHQSNKNIVPTQKLHMLYQSNLSNPFVTEDSKGSQCKDNTTSPSIKFVKEKDSVNNKVKLA